MQLTVRQSLPNGEIPTLSQSRANREKSQCHKVVRFRSYYAFHIRLPDEKRPHSLSLCFDFGGHPTFFKRAAPPKLQLEKVKGSLKIRSLLLKTQKLSCRLFRRGAARSRTGNTPFRGWGPSSSALQARYGSMLAQTRSDSEVRRTWYFIRHKPP